MQEEYYYLKEKISKNISDRKRQRSCSATRPRCPSSTRQERALNTAFCSGSSNSICNDMIICPYTCCCSCRGPANFKDMQKRCASMSTVYCREKTPPPHVQRCYQRLPTPEPDVIEKIHVRRQPQRIIEKIIERPRTPPPVVIHKEICEPAPPPIVRTKIVDVDHKPRSEVKQQTKCSCKVVETKKEQNHCNDQEYRLQLLTATKPLPQHKQYHHQRLYMHETINQPIRYDNVNNTNSSSSGVQTIRTIPVRYQVTSNSTSTVNRQEATQVVTKM